MTDYDKELGAKVAAHLAGLSIETPMDFSMANKMGPRGRLDNIRWEHTSIMQSLGLDLTDDSLRETPTRVSKMYCDEIFYGLDYNQFPKCTTIENRMKMDEMIAGTKIDVLSMCEHHFVPFIGFASIGYIPSTRVLGLSKMNRVVDFFSRRPQVQERLTLQIYETLCLLLETPDVAVVIKADHLCIRLRGVKQQSETITSKMGGRFMDKPALREEFLALTR